MLSDSADYSLCRHRMTESALFSSNYPSFGIKELSLVYGSCPGSTGCDSVFEDVDYITTELRKQETAVMDYIGTSPQITYRKEIIQWMKTISNDLKLLRKTIFHGVYLFDRFSDTHDIAIRQIHLVALTCLYLSAKMGENDGKGTKMGVLKNYLPEESQYTEDLFVQIEKYVLRHFNWNIMSITVIDFAEYFLIFGIDTEDICFDPNNNRAELGGMAASASSFSEAKTENIQLKKIEDAKIKATLKIHVLKMAVEVYNLLDDILSAPPPPNEYPPSLIAASSIMYGRIFFRLIPWTDKLEFVTQHKEEEVSECFNRYISKVSTLPGLLQDREKHFEDESEGVLDMSASMSATDTTTDETVSDLLSEENSELNPDMIDEDEIRWNLDARDTIVTNEHDTDEMIIRIRTRIRITSSGM